MAGETWQLGMLLCGHGDRSVLCTLFTQWAKTASREPSGDRSRARASKGCHGDLLSLVRLHLLKVVHLPKAASPTQGQVFIAWTCGGHVQTSDNVENGIISSNDSKVGAIMTAWAVLPRDAEGFFFNSSVAKDENRALVYVRK
jgi:hypothetical protein